MNYRLSLPYNSYSNVSEAFKFIIEFIAFHVEGILASNSKGWIEYDYNKIIDYLDKSNIDSFNIVSNFSNYLDFKNSITFRRLNLLQLNLFAFSLESHANIRFEELLCSAAKKRFTMMLRFDFLKAKWQSERLIDNYKAFNKNFEHLPKIWDDELSPILGEVIDISKNPGHLKETQGIILMAAPEMWFGPGSWGLFDKKRVISFPKAIEVKEILPDVVYVKLFETDEPDYEKYEILDLQKRFREWTRMDEIEQSLNQASSKPSKAATLKLDIRDPDNAIEKLNITDLTKNRRNK
jgi:hypothetical protein